jgi:hypothetical protein
MQQALDYAATLDVPFVFSSNGDGFVFHDRTGQSATKEANLRLDAFPSPADLWARYRAWKGLDAEAEQIVLQDYYDDGSGEAKRYYQVTAINRTIEAIAKGANRVLLVMATGSGKTRTAFQIIWRLWKAGRKKRILFLADRNVLIDQTMLNDFRPFGPAMAKLSTGAKTIERQDGTTVDVTLALDKKRRIDTAFEIYLGLYQAITGPEERQKLYREFSPGFFDLIVIDECHRGSAADDSAWRERGRRTIAIDGGLVERLRGYRDQMKRLAASVPDGAMVDLNLSLVKLPDGALLFPGEDLTDLTKLRDGHAVTRTFRRHAKGLGFNIKFHWIRASHLTILLDRGEPVHVVAKRAGHDPVTLLRSYARWTKKTDARVAETIADMSRKTIV